MKYTLLNFALISITFGSFTVFAEDSQVKIPVPCLSSSSSAQQIIMIQPGSPANATFQQVFGQLSSWEPKTGIIGFKSELNNQEEKIKLRGIRFELPERNPIAQMVFPTFVAIGIIEKKYSTDKLKIVNGTLSFPDCESTWEKQPIAFKGTITVDKNEVILMGEVFSIQLPSDGEDSTSTRRKGG